MRLQAVVALTILALARMSGADLPTDGYEVVHVYPHDGEAFTEGLLYHDGFLYEATGLAGKSSVRKVELSSGKVLQQHEVPQPYFGEGIVVVKDRLIQLTYTTGTGFVYNLKTFQVESEFHYPGQGWAMTTDGKSIIMDDGTPELRFWDPETLKEQSRRKVTANGVPVQNINELEWVKGELYANIWHSNRIACIDPKTGEVRRWIDLTGLLPKSDLREGWEAGEQVLNGIAYDAAHDRLFVTGKYWPKLFEIKIRRKD